MGVLKMFMDNDKVAEFVSKEFGFLKELVKADNVENLMNFNFWVKDYLYHAEVSEDCGNGNLYYSLSIIDHM